MTSDNSLHNDFKALLASIPGAPERERILQLLPQATCIALDDSITQNVSDTLSDQTWTVEHNLDFFTLPAPITWIEWNEKARRTDMDLMRDGAVHPERVGVLLARHEEDPQTIVGAVAWRLPDGKTDHAAAFISWNEDQISSLSKSARHSFSKVKTECLARMMSLVYTHVPSGFISEMEVLEDVRDRGESIEQMTDIARREASAEALFVIASALMLQCSEARIEVQGEWHVAKADDAGKKKPWLSRFRKPGFQRKNSRKGATLRWNAT